MIRINFHTHTKASFDGYNSFKAIYKNCKKIGINVIAITDHDSVIGAYNFIDWLKTNRKTDLEIIIGEEVTCNDGTHIIGLFITDFIPSDTLLNVIKIIKQHCGFFFFPHPARKDGIMQSEFFNDAIKLGDAFEVFNAKINNDYNILAQEEILKHPHLLPLAGSDAHYNSDILKCMCEIKLDLKNLKESLLNCNKQEIKIFGLIKLSGDYNYFSTYYRFKNKLNLPLFVRKMAKFAFPLYKNFKERNAVFKLENIIVNESRRRSQ